MNEVQVYHYDPSNGAYLGATVARRDPVGKRPVVPAYATIDAPPPPKAGQVAVREGGAWHLVEDHRGTTAWTSEGDMVLVEEIGPLAEGLTLTPPDRPVYADVAAAKSRIVGEIGKIEAVLIGQVSRGETLSWPAKEAAARAHLARHDDPLGRALLAEEAAETGETHDELAGRIVAKADYFRLATARLAGQRRTTFSILDAAQPDEFEQLVANAITDLNALAARFAADQEGG